MPGEDRISDDLGFVDAACSLAGAPPLDEPWLRDLRAQVAAGTLTGDAAIEAIRTHNSS